MISEFGILSVLPPLLAIILALKTFSGVKRRQEIRGVKNGITVMDDFAHHPTAVRQAIDSFGDLHAVINNAGIIRRAPAIEFSEDDLVFRCNLVSEEDGILLNHSAGHISTEEAKELINELNNKLGDDRVQFYSGVSYRHVMIVKGGKSGLQCTPPHDHPGEKLDDYLPTPASAVTVIDDAVPVRSINTSSNSGVISSTRSTCPPAAGICSARRFWTASLFPVATFRCSRSPKR